jgi:hypothetical protein
MSVFVHAQGIKTVHAGGGGGGSKNAKILSTYSRVPNRRPVRLFRAFC